MANELAASRAARKCKEKADDLVSVLAGIPFSGNHGGLAEALRCQRDLDRVTEVVSASGVPVFVSRACRKARLSRSRNIMKPKLIHRVESKHRKTSLDLHRNRGGTT